MTRPAPVSAPMLILRLTLPPNLANARMHWRVKERKRKEYFWSLDCLQAMRCIPPPPAEPIAKATVTAVLCVKKEHDDDNAFLRAYKFPLDWLKTRGYIVDDKRSCVRCAVPEQDVNRYREWVEITLTTVA